MTGILSRLKIGDHVKLRNPPQGDEHEIGLITEICNHQYRPKTVVCKVIHSANGISGGFEWPIDAVEVVRINSLAQNKDEWVDICDVRKVTT